MLTLTGDILNWLAAGIVFPLMFLPLAAVITKQPGKSSILWFALVTGAVAAGAGFAALAPVLRVAPSVQQGAVFFALAAASGAAIFALGGPAAFIKRLTPAIEAITRAASRTVMWLLLAMALVQFAVVVLRYVFGINYIFMQESITYMHGAVFLLASGYALASDGHVRVDIFYRDAAPGKKALIDFLGTYFLLFPVCLVLLWAASPYVASSWAVLEGSTETSGIQGVFLLKTLIPAFAILLAMAGFNIAARASDTLRERA